MGQAMFGDVVTAMVTPFKDDLSFDVDGAVALAKHLAADGNDAVVLAGTTGESPTLTWDETAELVRSVSEAVTIPVIAGTGSNDTHHAVEQTKVAKSWGASGILSVCPYYNRPSQAGLDAHFRAVADATDLPVLIYDIPIRTGRKIDTDVLARLANEVPNIVGVKDAAGSPAETARLVAMCGDDFQLYSGDDNQTLPLLAVGAVGVISVAGHWAAQEIGEMIRLFQKGDTEGARATNARLLDSWSIQSGDLHPNPIPSKCILRILGLPGGPTRPPMGPEPEWLEDKAREVLSALGKL